jgi:hypothetical protein
MGYGRWRWNSDDDLVVIVVTVWSDFGSTRYDSGNIITPLCQLMFIQQLLMGSRYSDCRVKDLRREALSFAPGTVGNVGDVIAAELATGASVDDEVYELSV